MLGLGRAGVFDPLAAQVVAVAIRKRRPDELRHRFGQNPKAGFAVAKRLLGAPPFGYVLARAENADDAALRVAQQLVAPSYGAFRAIGAEHDTLGARLGVFRSLETSLECCAGHRPQTRRDECGDPVLADNLVGRGS